MTLVVVERSFEHPCDAGGLQARENEGAWCLKQHDVTHLRTWFSADNQRMICLYGAPDAESVRLAQKTIEMPVERIWPAHEVLSEAGPDNLIVAERQFEQCKTLETVRAMRDKNKWCLDMYDVAKVHTYLSHDGHRAFCTYTAPDAEAVRNASRKAQVPFSAIWRGTVIEPSHGDG